jgi:hypothetical protein
MFVPQAVYVPHLTAGVEVKIGEVSLQENGIEKIGAHDLKFTARERCVF